MEKKCCHHLYLPAQNPASPEDEENFNHYSVLSFRAFGIDSTQLPTSPHGNAA